MKIPYVKAKDKNTGKWYEGFYLEFPVTTFCFSEDYLTNPVKFRKCLAFYQSDDWGLPNTLKLCNSIDESSIDLIGYIETSNTVYDPNTWICKKE